MNTFTLHVISNLHPTEKRPDPRAVQIMEVFTVECDAGLAWVKGHADQMAKLFTRRDYVALMVTPKLAITT